ncbi:ribose transport system ATP-binding protein [Rhizobium sp. BK650]|uniref:sugar ABC transporter ATP-binding protein n=1 Tax=Rhizobium sp. BK650 TaxID=2586990 RepID=UPI00160C31AA|nr:sugar ABC transporter ATP-binding protein [Rhizobium sp. BK650]MBB3659842.1 ribose transport system ATP-binding protein [Rhizobium sp. BK650]
MALILDRIGKSFPGVRALNNAALTLDGGEIHALMGENGAGKSTLIKIITGVHRPDSGTVTFDDTQLSLASPRDAISLGISAVHQERNLIPRFSVAENILLESLPVSNGLVDFRRANEEARTHLRKVGLDVDPATEVRRLSVAQMQMVEIAKALSHQAKVLLLDEPTASITDAETEILFRLVRQLRDQGTAILFVSHKLEEVLSLCDRVTVLRDGETTLRGAPMTGMTRQTLIEAMIGRAERPLIARSQKPQEGMPKLELRDVATAAGHDNVSFSLRRGEILGLYGLVGAGRTELVRAVIGKDKLTSGTVVIDGKPVRIRSVEEAIKRFRMGYVSEDRKHEGVILAHPIRSNIAMTVWGRIASTFGLIGAGKERKTAAPLARQLEIRTPNLEQLVGNLSGGNQQKVSLAKWLAADVDILFIDEPTVGIDIKAKTYIHELINGLADKGMAILLISSDMPEMVALADRILVMHDFKIVHEHENDHKYETASRAIMSAIHAAEPALARTAS